MTMGLSIVVLEDYELSVGVIQALSENHVTSHPE